MASRALRWLPREEAKKIVNASLPNREYEKSLFRHLIAEGVLAEDLMYAGTKAEPDRVIRFSYERFADHHVAKLMLDADFDKKRPKQSFSKTRRLGKRFKDNYSYWINQGLIEALCIPIPERCQKELPELIPQSENMRSVRSAFVESLLWRTRSAFSKFTFQYINDEVLRYADSREQFWNTVITLAPVPGHPLNANRLHRHLSESSMSDRDAWWSTFIHRQYGTQSSVDRILDWAWSPLRTQQLETEVSVLYATALGWLLTTSNRFLRDHATKSLLNLIGNKRDVLLAVLDRFRTVNDPYVLERICAVAYGCAMRMDTVDGLKTLATAVYNWFFASGEPYPHILFRDYARGVIECAVTAGAQLEFDVSKVRPPYKSTWPKTIPSASELETKYGWRNDKMPDLEWARLSIYNSVMGFGDFARYVIGTNSGSFEWTKTRLGKRPSMTAKDRYEQFLGNLNAGQSKAWHGFQEVQWHGVIQNLRQNLDDQSKETTPKNNRKNVLRAAEKAFLATLSPAELRTYRKDVVGYLANPRGDEDRFDLSIAQRWILQRVFDLGWTAEKFGGFDRDINAHMWSRDAQKSERMGKKYQWIAYHEFLGLVADQFEFGNPLFDDSQRKYEGPWQMYVRDIDPSCALRKIAGGDKFDDAWWSPRDSYTWNSEDEGRSWISRTDDLPKPEPLIESSNPEDGSTWWALEINPEWREPIPKYEIEFSIPERRLWYQIRSFLVERKSAAKAFSWLSKQHFWGRWMPENPDYHTVFLGEFYWAPALRTHDPIFIPPKDTPKSAKSIPYPLVFTEGTYYSEMNSFDCSLEEKFSIYLPGAWLVRKMGLRWHGAEGQFFDSKGELIAFDPAVSLKGNHALLIRKDRFLSFLKSEGYEIIWFLLAGKQVLGHDWNTNEWPGELQISGVYRPKGEKVAGGFRSKQIMPRRSR